MTTMLDASTVGAARMPGSRIGGNGLVLTLAATNGQETLRTDSVRREFFISDPTGLTGEIPLRDLGMQPGTNIKVVPAQNLAVFSICSAFRESARKRGLTDVLGLCLPSAHIVGFCRQFRALIVQNPGVYYFILRIITSNGRENCKCLLSLNSMGLDRRMSILPFSVGERIQSVHNDTMMENYIVYPEPVSRA